MRFFALFAVLLFVTALPAQERGLASPPMALPSDEEPQNPPTPPAPQLPGTQNSANNPAQATPDSPSPSTSAANSDEQPLNPQPKRILGVMPNFRAVSAGASPPLPTPKESFLIATKNSFDYSAFLFNGFTSLEAIGADAHPNSAKALPAMADTTGVVSLTGPTATTSSFLSSRRFFIRTNATMPWARAVSRNAQSIGLLVSSSRPTMKGIIPSMPLRFLAGASPRPSRSRIIPRSPAPPGPSPESTVWPLEEARSGMSSVNSGPTSQSTFLHRHP